MAKILISFLGTGKKNQKGENSRKYEKVTYEIDNQRYEESFVTKVLDQHYAVDKVLYVGTLKSMWEEVYSSYFSEENVDDQVYFNLAENIESFSWKSKVDDHKQKIIDAFSHQEKINPILIQYGINREELNYNIQQILSCEQYINSGDEVYIDITHGFRSLPLVLMNVLNYLKDVSQKQFEIKSISYGMFELKNLSPGGSVPIVELDVISELHENIKAAHEFNTYGNAYLFAELLKDNCKSMSKVLKEFSESKSLNHIYDLKNKINQFNSFKSEYEKLSPVQALVIPRAIRNLTEKFSMNEKDSNFQYKLSEWMFENKQYGFAAIILIEGLVTKVCELTHLKYDVKDHRDFAKDLIFATKPNKARKDFFKKYKADEYVSFIYEHDLRLQEEVQKPIYKDIQECWRQANEIRKSVAHAIPTKKNVSAMIKQLQEALAFYRTSFR